MTKKCPFYKEDRFEIGKYPPSKTHPPKLDLIPYCKHPKHSPVSWEEAYEANKVLLRCNGIRDECPIADKWDDQG